MGRALAIAWCAALFAAGCGPPETPAAQLAPLPPGDALPLRVDAMLYGSAQTCRADNECPGAVCYYGESCGMR